MTPVKPMRRGRGRLRTQRSFDRHSMQSLSINRDSQRIMEKPGAGVLPKVQGPDIKIEPPVKEWTKVKASPQ